MEQERCHAGVVRAVALHVAIEAGAQRAVLPENGPRNELLSFRFSQKTRQLGRSLSHSCRETDLCGVGIAGAVADGAPRHVVARRAARHQRAEASQNQLPSNQAKIAEIKRRCLCCLANSLSDLLDLSDLGLHLTTLARFIHSP